MWAVGSTMQASGRSLMHRACKRHTALTEIIAGNFPNFSVRCYTSALDYLLSCILVRLELEEVVDEGPAEFLQRLNFVFVCYFERVYN